MSDQKDVCAWKGCTKEITRTTVYANCNKCWKNMSRSDNIWCYSHRNHINPSTNCSYMPPYFYSCLKCYPEDFDKWIPEEKQWGSIQNWKNWLDKARDDIAREEKELKENIAKEKAEFDKKYPFYQEINDYKDMCYWGGDRRTLEHQEKCDVLYDELCKKAFSLGKKIDIERITFYKNNC